MKRKNQRLILLVLAVLCVFAAIVFAMAGLREKAAFFYSPGDLARRGYPPPEQRVRIGGMVKLGSITREPDGVTINFVVTEPPLEEKVRVRYSGIVPDLFKENSGVVAEGRFQADRLFVADEILAKHDENYMPPQLDMKKGEHKSESLK